MNVRSSSICKSPSREPKCFTTRTGVRASMITPSATLPSRIAAERLRPRVEMTFRSTACSEAASWMARDVGSFEE